MINLVCGAPGSGKTTYALNNKKRGDVIIDLDLLFQAVTGLDIYDKPEALLGFVIDLKKSAIDLAKYHHGVKMIANVWIVTGGAKLEERYEIASKCGAEHIFILNTPAGECIKRITQDERRQGKPLWYWRKIIREWHANFEPWCRDEFINQSSI